MTSRIAAIATLVGSQVFAAPCPLQMCVNSGPEFQSDFTVQIDAAGTSVSGAKVEIGDGRNLRQFTAVESNALTSVNGLPPGNYWLTAIVQGQTVASFCFHVKPGPGGRGGRTHVKETLRIDRNLGNRVTVNPGVVGPTRIQFTNLLSGSVTHGHDVELPSGFYVLQIDPVEGGVEFEPLRMTVEVTGGLPPSSLHFAHRDGSGGPGCGSGPALYLTRSSN